MMNANSYFGTLRYPLLCIQSCLLMSLITRTTNRTGLNISKNDPTICSSSFLELDN